MAQKLLERWRQEHLQDDIMDRPYALLDTGVANCQLLYSDEVLCNVWIIVHDNQSQDRKLTRLRQLPMPF